MNLPLAKLLLITMIFMLSGCSKPDKASSAKKAVEDVVGRTTLQQEEMIKKKLKGFEQVQREREKEIDEVK